MASTKNDERELVKSIEHARERHSELLESIDQTRALLEKHSRKLATIETEIAELQRRYQAVKASETSEVEAQGDNLRHALLIINPNSGIRANGGEQLDNIRARLRAHGIDAEVGMKKSAKGTRKLAKKAAEDGEELVIVAGGDGTIEDIAAQLVGSTTILGIIPVGTMNNVARVLGIPLIVEDACALMGMGVTRQIDVGRVVANADPVLEYFLETAGIGLSAIAIPAGDAAKSGRFDAVPDALRKLFNIKPQRMTLELDDGKIVSAHSQVITVSNGPLIGNNILVAPDAKMDDGLLDIAVYDGMNKADLLGYFLAAANGKRVDDPRVKFYRTARVRIKALEPIAVHSDKDLIEAKNVLEIEVLPHRLSVIVGNGIALTLPVESAPSVPPLTGPQTEAIDAQA